MHLEWTSSHFCNSECNWGEEREREVNYEKVWEYTETCSFIFWGEPVVTMPILLKTIKPKCTSIVLPIKHPNSPGDLNLIKCQCDSDLILLENI